MKFNTIGEITDRILELENEHDLLNWSLRDVKIYQSVRHLIYNAAVWAHIEKKQEQGFLRKGFVSKIVNKSSRIKNFFVYSPFRDKRQSDYLLLESGRKQKINGKFIDVFTARVKKNLEDAQKKVSVYQTSYFYDSLSEKADNVGHLDYIYLMTIFKSKLSKINFNDREREQIENYGKILSDGLNIAPDFFSLIKNNLVYFFIYSEYYGKLLDIKKPKEVFIVNFCDKTALISECKKRKIKVTDIQHGFISSKDIIYHYPDSIENELDYFPDRFLAWSEFWLGGCKLPLSKNNIEFIENYYLTIQAERFKDTPKNPKKVLIVSQSSLTVQILEKIFTLVKNNPDFQFFYKPHPIEYSYIANIKEYSELLKFKNFFVIEMTDNLFSHFADSKYVIGVYTTSLIEALYFNCEVFILDLPGAEMMEYLIESGKAKKIKELNLK